MKLSSRRFRFLGIGILALLIFIPFLVFAVGEVTSGFRLYSNTTQILDLTAIGAGKVCVTNNSALDYFIPTRTLSEWNSFAAAAIARLSVSIPSTCCGDGVCSGFETPSSCWADCASKCDYQPAGVYTGAIYTADTNCGATPGCGYVYPTGGSTIYTMPNAFGSKEGGGCGVLKIQRYSQCATLMNPKFYICDGGQCITGINYSNYTYTEYCIGTYDALINTCIYRSRVAKTLSGWGQSTYVDFPTFQNGSYSFNTNPAINGGTVGSWGKCYTAIPCGDGVCSTGYGETCNSCSSDCGACARISCYTNSQCSNNYCEGLSATCQGSYGCNNYYDEGSCSMNGCYWQVTTPGTCVGF